MPLNAAGIASTINSTYQGIRGTNNNVSSLSLMGSSWQLAYHTDSSAGVNPIASSAAPANAALIGSAYAGLTASHHVNIDILAQMFAAYWATSHLTPIGACVAISGNDAMTKVSAYKAAIISVITTTESTPYLEVLFSAVEAVTKTITWYGVNAVGAPMTGTVS